MILFADNMVNNSKTLPFDDELTSAGVVLDLGCHCLDILVAICVPNLVCHCNG